MQLSSSLSLFFFSFILLGALIGHGKAEDGYHNSTAVIDVGVILDFETWVGKMTNACISMALTDFYAAHKYYSTRIVLHARDSKEDVVAASAEALDLLRNIHVKAIIGPEKSAQAAFLADLGDKAQVPILSFSTSPFLPSTRTPYFIQTAQNSSSLAKAIAAIVHAFTWRAVVPIYDDSTYEYGIVLHLINALQEIDVSVPYQSAIPPSATDDQILKELHKLMAMRANIFVVHMHFSSLGSRFFSRAKEIGMMDEGYVWITTGGLTDFLDSMDSSTIDSVQGILDVKQYVPKSIKVENFMSRWKRKILLENPSIKNAELSIVGLRAYDTAQALAMAVEQVGTTEAYFLSPKTNQNSTDFVSLGISKMGPKLLAAISNIKLEGVSGEFRFVNGQVHSSDFQIINVVGKVGREIGFWTPTSGLSRVLDKSTNRTYSAFIKNLKPVIWPGESITLPRGWVTKKLRIGVPLKSGFNELVKVDLNSSGDVTNVSGFCMDVFNAVREILPYPILYEFVAFEGAYDDLLYQLHLEIYDAVVADVTIMADRSLYVDFTYPYIDSGVSMIVPAKRERMNAWIFLKPLSCNLWLTTIAAFILTGFVVWVLEHQINEEFRGTAAHQIGVIFWFAFSTLVYAHRERVMSNWSRFVVIIWVFVVLILTSSYTANLTSMLTIQQLNPRIKSGGYMGYSGSPVKGVLTQLGFPMSKLKRYETPAEEYAEALSKGSKNGGVDAIFDEVPYLRIFLMKYCGQYTIVGPTYSNQGFGFAFPRGAPLAMDFSRAILKLREGHKMLEMEHKWFGNREECMEPSPTNTSSSFTLDNFRGLFLITGSASSLSLLVFVVRFLRRHGHVLTSPDDSETSFHHRLLDLAKYFNYKELSYHSWQKNQKLAQGMAIEPGCIGEAPQPLYANNAGQSPLSMSNDSDSIGRGGGTSSPASGNLEDASAVVSSSRNVNGGGVGDG